MTNEKNQQKARDEVFTKIERPNYPATCDQCGAEGTNAQMTNHDCEQAARFPCYIGEHDTCVGKSKRDGECPCPCGHVVAEDRRKAAAIVKRCGIRDGLFKGARIGNAVESIATLRAEARAETWKAAIAIVREYRWTAYNVADRQHNAAIDEAIAKLEAAAGDEKETNDQT